MYQIMLFLEAHMEPQHALHENSVSSLHEKCGMGNPWTSRISLLLKHPNLHRPQRWAVSHTAIIAPHGQKYKYVPAGTDT